jgi:AcrR family transcriptional regulator
MQQQEQEIIMAAMKLFMRFGIKSITMDELARQMGVSKKTIYLYFKDKNDLVDRSLQALFDEQNCGIKQILQRGLNAIQEIFEFYNHVNLMIRDYNPALEFDLQRLFPKIFERLRTAQRKNIFEAVEKNLTKGKKEGLYRKDLDASIIAKLHVMRLENMMHSDLVTPEEMHSKKFFNEVFKYHLHGIVSAEGLEYVKNNYPEILKK